MDKSCLTCKYKGVMTNNQKEQMAVCRRYPPTVVGGIVSGPNGPGWTTTTALPGISPGEWCGEYAVDLIGFDS